MSDEEVETVTRQCEDDCDGVHDNIEYTVGRQGVGRINTVD